MAQKLQVPVTDQRDMHYQQIWQPENEYAARWYNIPLVWSDLQRAQWLVYYNYGERLSLAYASNNHTNWQ